jgi:Zn finger protein HypA/HybF involved in hydrogenase expression
MNLHPFNTVCANAERKIAEGWTVYQQWKCAHCGVKQTMPDKNKFYMRGKCEECGKETDIVKDGMNFMATSDGSFDAVASLLKDMMK